MDFKRILAMLKFSANSRAEFYGLVASFVEDGVPLNEALLDVNQFYKGGRNPQAYITTRILADARGTYGTVKQMSESLAWCITAAERLSLDAGEQAGDLSMGLRTAASVAVKRAAIVSTIRRKLFKPAGLLAGAIAVLLFVRSTTIPVFIEMMPREAWPMIPALLGAISDSLPVTMPLILGAIVVYLTVVAALADRWKPDVYRDALDRMVFPWTIYAQTNLALTLVAIAALINAKVPFGSAIERIRDNSSPWLSAKLHSVMMRMRRGEKEGSALGMLYQGETRWLIQAYGKRSNFAEALFNLSERLNLRVMSRIGTQLNVLSLVLQVVVAAVIVMVGLSFGQMTLALKANAGAL